MITGTYEKCESHIQDGDLVFILSDGTFVHSLIEFFTQSPQIHVGVACWVTIHNTKHLLVFDTNGGTRRRVLSLSHFKDHNMDIVAAPVAWEDMVERVVEHLGHREYSWLQAAYIGVLEIIERFFFIRLPSLDFGSESEVCSKFIAEIVQLDQTEVSPAALFKLLMENGVKIRAEIRK